MIDPIKMTIVVDHLTVLKKDLDFGDNLEELFAEAIPDDVRIVESTMHGKEYVMFFGQPEALYKLMFNVTKHFDLLIV